MSTNDRSDDPLLDVAGLEKRYGGTDGVTAVDGVSLTVDHGEVVGLLGPNGAGKTTTIKCALGLVEPTAGVVRVAGVDPQERPRAASRRVAAVLEGARNVYWRLTVRENLRFFTGLQGAHPDDPPVDHDRLLSTLDLAEKADTVARSLSRGMQQKLSIACALVRDTPLLFLDEPTLGLDVEAGRALRDEVRRLVEEENRGVVVSSHDMDVVRDVCDRVVILNDGAVLVTDDVEELIDVFRQQTYRVELAASGAARGRLEPFDPEWDDDAVSVRLPNHRALYDLVDRLRAAGAVVERIDAVDPDLEEVFLSVISEEDGPERPESRTPEPELGVEL